MEENTQLKNISHEDLISVYKTVIDFVKDLEKEIEKNKQEEVNE